MIFIHTLSIIIRIAKLFTIISYEILNYNVIKLVNNVYNKPYNRLILIKNIAKRLEYENIVYVKIFQALCLNKDLLYSEEQEFLLKYTDNVPYNINDINYDLLDKLEQTYSIKLNNVIPINCGIIGLVFDGHDCVNNKVIIKMLKKNIVYKFTNVFDELLYISYICNYIPYIKSLKLSNILLDNKEILFNQMDFIKEVNSLEIFTKKYKNNKEYRFPKVYREITEKYHELMVMENIKGLTFKDIENADNTIKEEFAYLINKFNILGMLYHSTIHCDMHCGNVFFYINDPANDPAYNQYPKYMLGLIDFGICTFPNKESQNAYYIFFNNIFYNHDYSDLEYVINNFIEEKYMLNLFSCVKKQTFYDEIIVCLELYNNHELSKHALINKLASLIYKYNMNFTQEFNKIILSIHTTHNFVKLLSSKPNDSLTKVIKELCLFNELINI
jgi:predicted unusual protein kinase regulating ubiquinone biosynthesis (AarF/ABC1/UbiB family)